MELTVNKLLTHAARINTGLIIGQNVMFMQLIPFQERAFFKSAASHDVRSAVNWVQNVNNRWSCHLEA
jgi:hypothetical protein